MMNKRNSRFADKVLLILAVTTAIFVAVNFISFWHTNIEQSTLITAWFSCVGVELAALISKRIAEHIKPKGDLSDDEGEETSAEDHLVADKPEVASEESASRYPRWVDLADNHSFAVGDCFTYYGTTYSVLREFDKATDKRPPALSGEFYSAVS